MKFASAITTRTDWAEAVEDLVRQTQDQLGGRPVDAVVLFVHPQFQPRFEDLVLAIQARLGARHLLGSTGAGIIGVDQEIEGQPAISLLAGELPGVRIAPFHLTEQDREEASGPEFWHFRLEVEPPQNPKFLLLTEPFSVQTVPLIGALSEAYPAAPWVGGVASGGQQAGENALFLDGKVLTEGAVGWALTGAVELRALVAPGCKPIGQPYVITRANKNIVFEIGGRPPMKVLEELLPQLPAHDQQLARSALFLGRVINEYREEYARGDFLIRTLIGQDPSSGALAVGDYLRTGQTVQFQVRDGQTADQDLRDLLEAGKEQFHGSPPRGAVLFSCLGRGQGMFGVPHHDIRLLHRQLGPVPTAGFFCNGEIGPVGDRAYVHGFTSVIGLFGEPVS